MGIAASLSGGRKPNLLEFVELLALLSQRETADGSELELCWLRGGEGGGGASGALSAFLWGPQSFCRSDPSRFGVAGCMFVSD